MAKKDLDLFAIIVDALEYYHTYVASTIKESTKRQNTSLLSEFKRFLDTLSKRDRTMAIFSQKGLNRYKKYLIDKLNKSKTDGKKKNFGVGQVNHCGSIIARLINKVLIEKYENITPVVWNKVKDTRREDQFGHIPLLDEEVAAIEDCVGLSDKDNEYRNIFLLHIECGQRVSDLGKLMMGEYKIEQGKKYKYIVISTQKENIKAFIPLTDRMKTMLERVQSLKLINPKDFDEKTKGKGNNTYNEAIKRIAQKAGLDRIIVKTDSVGKVQEKPLYEIITSHDARCTFITNMIKKGVKPDVLCKMTGHASDEMIKRVYAQLTEHQEISRIESDLFTDIGEDGSYEDKPQQKSDISNALPAAAPSLSEPDSTSLLESKEFQEYDRYVQGLYKCVDDAISEAFVRCPSESEKANSLYKEVQETLKSELKEVDLGSKEKIIEFWHRNESSIIEEGKEIQDYTKTHIDIVRINHLIAFIDYLKEHQVGEDAIDKLEKIFHELCEENPTAYYCYKCVLISDIGDPIYRFSTVFYKTCHYIIENRPVADETDIEDKGEAFRHGPKWHIIFKELQLFPLPILDTLTQNTKCLPEIKTAIFNCVRNGDYDGFVRIIAPYENDVRILIRRAYYQRYWRTLVQAIDYMHETLVKDPNLSLEKIELAQDTLNNLNPFVFKEDQNPDFLNKETKEIDLKKLMLWVLDNLLEAIENMKKYARSSEIRALNRVLSLVDMDQHPEIKTAYEEYKAKQNTSPDPNQEGGEDVSKNAGNDLEKTEDPQKTNKEPKNAPKDKGKVDNSIPSKRNIDVDKLIELLTEDNDLNGNNRLITLLECDNNDADVKTCLKHFLGYKSQNKSQEKSPTPLSFKLRWNRDNMLGLKFLIRLLLNSNTEATRENVIKYEIVNGLPEPYDGISKEFVSNGKGQTGIWPSVRNVFYKCNTIMNAGLGKTESASEKNKKHLETVADIYFECKK